MISMINSYRLRVSEDAPGLVDIDSRQLGGTLLSETERVGFATHLHSWAVNLLASNPKVYVYGFGGVTGVRTTPDYNSNTPMAKVYQDFVAPYLACVPLSNDSSRDWTSTLWFLDFAGIGFHCTTYPGLPTWAPNFAGAASNRHSSNMDPEMYFSGSCHGNARSLAKDTPLPRLEGSIFCCTVKFVHEIKEKGPLLLTYQFLEHRDADSSHWLLWLYDQAIASRANGRIFTGIILLIVMAKTLLQVRKDLSREESASIVQLLIADVRYVCETHRSINRTTFSDQLCKELPQAAMDEMLAVMG
jgi:hypothetical protein